MRIVQVPAQKKRPKRKYRSKFVLFLAVLVVFGAMINYFRPLPSPTISLQLPKLPIPSTPALMWPTYGQAAVGSDGYGVLSTYGRQAPLATASVAKVVTALCILQKFPLNVRQDGPTIIIGDADLAIYNDYTAQNGSRLPVFLGEKLTEYQALQALLLPSANNIADSLALWAFGSQTAYAAYANQYLQKNGLAQTHIGSDASGFDPSSTSTATDLTRLGILASRNDALLEIAGQKTADLPVAGTVYNYDSVLGVHGITGLKTGNSEADNGAFLFTATLPVGTTKIAISGAVMDAPSLDEALTSSTTLVGSVAQGFEQTKLVVPGQNIGSAQAKWSAAIPIIAGRGAQILRWKAASIREHHQIHTVSGARNLTIGTLEFSAGPQQTSTPLKLARSLPSPSFWWRLTRH